jgi:hypothetical protein
MSHAGCPMAKLRKIASACAIEAVGPATFNRRASGKTLVSIFGAWLGNGPRKGLQMERGSHCLAVRRVAQWH